MNTAELRMGCRAPRPVTQRARLMEYAVPGQMTIPPQADWTGNIRTWGMLANDRASDCVAAGLLHAIMAFVAVGQKRSVTFDDNNALALYQHITGLEGAQYNPDTGENDNGCYLNDGLLVWQKEGIIGHKIDGWVDLEPTFVKELAYALANFGPLPCSFALPLTAKAQLAARRPWSSVARFSPDSKPMSWGPHMIPLVAYDGLYFWGATWGKLQPMTWEWVMHYGMEAHAVVSEDLLDARGVNPVGLNVEEMLKDLAQLGPVK